jgi:ribose-phosphate pyrophosphokinase
MLNEKIVVTGNISDSPIAIDISRLLGLQIDIADAVALKSFANSEFCPRFIADLRTAADIGNGLHDTTVVIVSTTSAHLDRNSLAMRNLLLARSAKENGAKKVILVEPDLFYSAQDRGPYRYGEMDEGRSEDDLKKFNGQPFSALLYAQLLKTAGVDNVLTVHNHSIKVQTVFKETFGDNFQNIIPADVYADYIRKSDMVAKGVNGQDLVICAPDHGARPFMNMVYDALDLPAVKRVILRKVRTGERQVTMSFDPESDITIEEIAGKDVIVLDDMVRTGTTIVQCCEMLKMGNPRKVCFGVTHFHTSQEARENLNSLYIDEIMTTNTIPTILNRDEQGRLRKKLVVLKIGKWMARAIHGILGVESELYRKNFYSIDMSSQNPRWPPPTV